MKQAPPSAAHCDWLPDRPDLVTGGAVPAYGLCASEGSGLGGDVVDQLIEGVFQQTGLRARVLSLRSKQAEEKDAMTASEVAAFIFGTYERRDS